MRCQAHFTHYSVTDAFNRELQPVPWQICPYDAGVCKDLLVTLAHYIINYNVKHPRRTDKSYEVLPEYGQVPSSEMGAR